MTATPSAATPAALAGAGNARTATCSTSSLTVGTPQHRRQLQRRRRQRRLGQHRADAGHQSGAGGSSNVALASAGGVASASSTYSAGYPVGAVNNNERAGINWGNGGGWNDATADTYPDWVQITFNGSKTIDRVVVYTLQDNYANPVEPTDTLTFSRYGVTAFTVQGWNGAAWITLGHRQRQQPGQAHRHLHRLHHRPHPRQRHQCPRFVLPHHRNRGLDGTRPTGPQLAPGIRACSRRWSPTGEPAADRRPGVRPFRQPVRRPRGGRLRGRRRLHRQDHRRRAADRAQHSRRMPARRSPERRHLRLERIAHRMIDGVQSSSADSIASRVTYDAANRPLSGAHVRLATVLDSPEGIQPLRPTARTAVPARCSSPRTSRRPHRARGAGRQRLDRMVGAAANLQKPEGLAFGDFNGAVSPALYRPRKAGGRVMRIGADEASRRSAIPLRSADSTGPTT